LEIHRDHHQRLCAKSPAVYPIEINTIDGYLQATDIPIGLPARLDDPTDPQSPRATVELEQQPTCELVARVHRPDGLHRHLGNPWASSLLHRLLAFHPQRSARAELIQEVLLLSEDFHDLTIFEAAGDNNDVHCGWKHRNDFRNRCNDVAGHRVSSGNMLNETRG